MACSNMATGRSESSDSALDQGRVSQCVSYGVCDSARPSHGRTGYLDLPVDIKGHGDGLRVRYNCVLSPTC